jgi:heme exporter protein D
MSEFFDMGGYGAFIWSSYGITVVVLLGLVIGGIWRMQRVQLALAEFESDPATHPGHGA